jgi:hypothetical protein
LEKRIESLLNQISGYTGYRSKEDRRDDDRRLREAIANSLGTTVATLSGVSAKLAEQRKLTNISAIERAVGATRLLADRVRTATYGYGGIFTDRSVDDFALTQLRQFDNAFQQEAKSLDDLANRIAASPDGPLGADITAYQTELNRLGLLFDARAAVVDTARPSKDAEVLSLLEPPPAPKVSPLATIRIGDALSILGDNFLVDATVTFIEPDRKVTLSRVGNDKSGSPVWLLGGTTEDVGSARLTESTSDNGSAGGGRSVEAVVATPTESKEGVSAQYGYTASVENTVSFWYSIGDQTRAFTGTSIEDGDIEVYGQA